MQLSISNYEILNFQNDNIVLSENGITKIKSDSLFDVIKAIHAKKSITKHELDDLFGAHRLDSTEAYEALKKIIKIDQIAEYYFEKITVAYNWDFDIQLENILKEELPCEFNVCHFDDLISNTNESYKYLVVLLCEQYNYQDLKNLYFAFVSKHPDSAISVGYCKGNTYVISQPFIPDMGNACHFCSIDKLLNNEYYKNSTNSWSKLLKFCHERETSIPGQTMSLFQKTLVFGATVQKIKTVTGLGRVYRFQDNILTETTISLNDGSVSESAASHWCMCDCIGGTK